MDAPPPQPAAPARAWVTWVVIGCGGVVLLSVLGTFSCIYLVQTGMKTVVDTAERSTKAWNEPGEKSLKGNVHVERRIGAVKSVTYISEYSGSMTRTTRYRVVGERGEAEATVEADFMKFEHQLHPEMLRGYLFHDGREIDLITGEESEIRRPPPAPPAHD